MCAFHSIMDSVKSTEPWKLLFQVISSKIRFRKQRMLNKGIQVMTHEEEDWLTVDSFVRCWTSDGQIIFTGVSEVRVWCTTVTQIHFNCTLLKGQRSF